MLIIATSRSFHLCVGEVLLMSPWQTVELSFGLPWTKSKLFFFFSILRGGKFFKKKRVQSKSTEQARVNQMKQQNWSLEIRFPNLSPFHICNCNVIFISRLSPSRAINSLASLFGGSEFIARMSVHSFRWPYISFSNLCLLTCKTIRGYRGQDLKNNIGGGIEWTFASLYGTLFG